MPTKRSSRSGNRPAKRVPSGKLILTGLTAYGFHGHNPAERQLGQHFAADLEILLDTREAAKTDELDDTLSYPVAARIAREILEGQPANLLETVAERIATAILEQPKVIQVTVRVSKRPPVPHLEAFTVEITRPVGGAAVRQ